jgi:hypothetical protein
MTKALQTPPGYAALFKDIKERVRTAQVRARQPGAYLAVLVDWPVHSGPARGRRLGTKVIERLAKDL